MPDPRSIDLLKNEAFLADLRGKDTEKVIAAKWGISSSTSHKWRKRLLEQDATEATKTAGGNEREDFDQDENGNLKYQIVADRILPLSWWLGRLERDGYDPENFTYTFGNSVWVQHTKLQITKTLYANRFTATLRAGQGKNTPEWTPIDRGPAITVRPPAATSFSIGGQWQTAVLAADSQIGYRILEDGTVDPFHDESAIDIMLKIVDIERPQQVVYMGDMIDLASQGRWAQEASFARTTQLSVDRTSMLLAETRERTAGKIVLIEGNHERRMQGFVETNMLSAFGLKRGNMPDTFPVMSLPYLLRTEEFGVNYMDAYPAAHWWINDKLRAEHGTKVRSSGSTAEKYVNETPHISRAFGHTHRLEAQSKTTWDRMGKIKSVAINPGCLCRVDGGVPGVNSAVGVNGAPLEIAENWQQGVAVIRFKESGEFFWELVQIEDGMTVYSSQELHAAV